MSADFAGKEASPTNYCWCQNSRVIALSCGLKISAVHYLDLSQFTRETDRQTEGQTDGQNYDSQYRPRICSCDKKLFMILNVNICTPLFSFRLHGFSYRLCILVRLHSVLSARLVRVPECQNIKKGGLDQYGAEHFDV